MAKNNRRIVGFWAAFGCLRRTLWQPGVEGLTVLWFAAQNGSLPWAPLFLGPHGNVYKEKHRIGKAKVGDRQDDASFILLFVSVHQSQ